MGNGEVGSIVLCCSLDVRIGGKRSLCAHGIIELLDKAGEQRHELLLLHLFQQTVEIHMEHLQEEVGSDEVGELMVVVAFIYMEQLLLITGYDGKGVLGQGLTEFRVERSQLEGVDEVVHIHHHPVGGHEVLLFQRLLTVLELLHEGFLGISIGKGLGLAIFLFPETVVHLLTIPRGGLEDGTEVATHEAITLTGGKSVPQDSCLADGKLRHIHVKGNLLVQFLYVDLRVTRKYDTSLLCACAQHHGKHHRNKHCSFHRLSFLL